MKSGSKPWKERSPNWEETPGIPAFIRRTAFEEVSINREEYTGYIEEFTDFEPRDPDPEEGRRKTDWLGVSPHHLVVNVNCKGIICYVEDFGDFRTCTIPVDPYIMLNRHVDDPTFNIQLFYQKRGTPGQKPASWMGMLMDIIHGHHPRTYLYCQEFENTQYKMIAMVNPFGLPGHDCGVSIYIYQVDPPLGNNGIKFLNSE